MGRDHEESQKDMDATDHVHTKHTQMLHVGYTFAYISHWMWLVFT